jgi:hypothetical protein
MTAIIITLENSKDNFKELVSKTPKTGESHKYKQIKRYKCLKINVLN